MEKQNRIRAYKGDPVNPGVSRKTAGINFAVEIPCGISASLVLYRKGAALPEVEIPFTEEHRTGRMCAILISGLKPDKYEYNFRAAGKIMQDPFARVIRGREKFGAPVSEDEHAVRCGFLSEKEYDWKEDTAPQIPYNEMILYKVHVRGYTKQAKLSPRKKGTFAGLVEMIPYWKEMGINAIELMPAYEFQECTCKETAGSMAVRSKKDDRINYWGYAQGFYFAPKASYCATREPDREFRDMVHALHQAGIECIMEMYFPENTPSLQVVRSLWMWKLFYHVDGFHVRGVQGICNLMATDPLFADTKLLNIYFPVEEIYGKKNLPKKRMVAECNDGFMIDVRRFLKGDEESLKAFAERMRRNPKGSGLINYIASHDGFTLCDLVSYEERHNEDNGEQNRDGRVQNYSWNCGEEGKSRKKKILELRNRQMKNAWCMLLLSAGTPMILAGDEFCNSQLGNNNPYCLDNEISWLDWKGYKSGNSEMFRFVKNLIAFRKKHKILHMGQELSMTDSLSCGFPGISYHSSSAWYGELDGQNRKIGVMYCGKYADEDELIYIAYNMHWMEHTFALPALPGGYRWNVALDTSEGILEEDKWRLLPDSRQVQVSSRTVIVLIGRKHKDVKESNRTLHNHHKA